MFGELWLIWMVKFASKVVAVAGIFFHACLWWFDWFWVLWWVVFWFALVMFYCFVDLGIGL